MSDLVKRLRHHDKTTILGMQKAYPAELGEAADRIEQLERKLAAEEALSDAFYFEANQRYIAQDACAAYRKARGLK